MSVSSVALRKSDVQYCCDRILTIIEETLDSIGKADIRVIFPDNVKDSSNELASQITKAAEIELISLKRCENDKAPKPEKKDKRDKIAKKAAKIRMKKLRPAPVVSKNETAPEVDDTETGKHEAHKR